MRYRELFQRDRGLFVVLHLALLAFVVVNVVHLVDEKDVIGEPDVRGSIVAVEPLLRSVDGCEAARFRVQPDKDSLPKAEFVDCEVAYGIADQLRFRYDKDDPTVVVPEPGAHWWSYVVPGLWGVLIVLLVGSRTLVRSALAARRRHPDRTRG